MPPRTELTHAKHDPAHCLLPGLFRSFKRGERKLRPLWVSYRYGEEMIEIAGPQLLGADDQRILQGLVAMAGPGGLVLNIDKPEGERSKQLALNLDPKWDALLDDALVVKGSFYQLAKEIGYADPGGHSAMRAIRGCIERLWRTTMIVQKGTRRRGFNIISTYESDSKTGKLHVALNPRLARAITGGRYTRLELAETRQLKGDAAVLIHQRLCGYIDAGAAHLVNMETLMGYVWHDAVAVEGSSSKRVHEHRVRKALDELAIVGWTIEEPPRWPPKLPHLWPLQTPPP